MKNFFKYIAGIMFMLIAIPVASANYSPGDYCSINQDSTNTYRGIYCDLARNAYKEADSEVLDTVAIQLGYDKTDNAGELVNTILIGDVDSVEIIVAGDKKQCNRVMINQFMNDNNVNYDELPKEIQDACSSTDILTEVNSWSNILTKVKTAYQKERVLYHTKKSMEYEFKSSEIYWDGSLQDTAPFDLIIDLNLVDVTLFGSKAVWEDNVYSFPVDEDENGSGDNEYNGPELDGGEGEGEGEGESETEDESINANQEESGDYSDDCVPANDPNANLGDTPGSGTPENCGNGEIDILYAEQCDDGNNISGDGCSQYCMLETTGADNICIDPEALTFKHYNNNESSGGNNNENNDNENGNNCPPGLFPQKDTSISGPGLGDEPDYPQNENYPGPYIGGTFKEFPPSNKPPCPSGYSEISYGEQSITIAGNEVANYCIPTELCADLNDIRDWLAGSSEWRDLPENDPERIAIEAIEAVFCVNITTANRPTSPYNINDGCVDCHIIAMVDALEKALETNVSPLENTTGSFAISSRFGPKFSLNLTTQLKSKVKLAPRDTEKTATDKADEAIEKIKDENTTGDTNVPLEETNTEKLTRQIQQEKERKEGILDGIENYKISNAAISDQTFAGRVKPLLEQMLSSFERIEAQFMGIADIELHKKPECPLN